VGNFNFNLPSSNQLQKPIRGLGIRSRLAKRQGANSFFFPYFLLKQNVKAG
jgi:hypothetical protein